MTARASRSSATLMIARQIPRPARSVAGVASNPALAAISTPSAATRSASLPAAASNSLMAGASGWSSATILPAKHQCRRRQPDIEDNSLTAAEELAGSLDRFRRIGGCVVTEENRPTLRRAR